MQTFKSYYSELTQHGHEGGIFVLDSECSNDLKLAVNTNTKYELVPPHQHRRNVAERAIHMYKNHLLAGLATCEKYFPISEWDRLLPQCDSTLNLLRSSRINPKLSAWSYIHGNHDFNKDPLAPPGAKMVFHAKLEKKASSAFRG